MSWKESIIGNKSIEYSDRERYEGWVTYSIQRGK